MRTGISAIYSEFTDALTGVLVENGVGPHAVADGLGRVRRQKTSRLQ